MNSGRHYIISPDGSYAWDLTVNPVRVDNSLTAGLLANAKFRSDNLMDLGAETSGEFGNVTLLVGLNTSSWRVTVNKLHLRAAYRLVDGVHVPNFGSVSDPELDLVWQTTMGVYFLVDLKCRSGKWLLDKQWLFAAAGDKTTWKLPLPNLYADCHLCHGMSERFYDTQFEAVLAACHTLQQSLWNADLPPELASAQAMFRWKPTGDGFEQLPMTGDLWTGLSTKVGVDHLARLL